MPSENTKSIGRRQVLAAFGATAGALTLGKLTGAVGSGTAPAEASATPAAAPAASVVPAPVEPAPVAQKPAAAAKPQLPPPGGDVLAFFGRIRPGARLGRHTVRAVHGVHLGAVAVILESPAGQQFQVDVMRRGRRAGIASTAGLTLFLANEGSGRLPSDESHGRGVMTLARALQRREQEGARAPALLSFEERNTRFPGGTFDQTWMSA